VKLFQIEEPDGSPIDPDLPGVAVGIDASGAQAEVAMAVGGNAVVLGDRDGFALDLPVPGPGGSHDDWATLFEGARIRAERALARPVSHAVVALASLDASSGALVERAAAAAGLTVLRIVRADAAGGETPACAAAILAEDLAPRPDIS
jgi:hypothetical protein